MARDITCGSGLPWLCPSFTACQDWCYKEIPLGMVLGHTHLCCVVDLALVLGTVVKITVVIFTPKNIQLKRKKKKKRLERHIRKMSA